MNHKDGLDLQGLLATDDNNEFFGPTLTFRDPQIPYLPLETAPATGLGIPVAYRQRQMQGMAA
jgi:hypothetical protein